MKKTFLTKTFVSAIAVSLLGLSTVSCVDSDYDINEDIDMTVGLGADGLKFKLGSTQKIMMKNVLQVDEDFKTDASNMFYLIKKGSTQSDFNIGNVSSQIEDVRYTTDAPVIDYDKIKDILGDAPASSLPVPNGMVFKTPQYVTASGNFKYDINNIDDDIISLERLNFYDGARVQIMLQIDNKGMDFNFLDVEGLEITFPDYIVIEDFSDGTIEGNTLKVRNRNGIYNNTLSLGVAYVRGAYLGDTPIGADRTMHLEAGVKFKSSFSFVAASDFEVNDGDEVNVTAILKISDNDGKPGVVSVRSAEGKFDPAIEPEVDDIDIASSIPDFLKDEEVTISVANPTLKFHTDMTGVPVQLKFNMCTSSKKGNSEIAEVWMPGSDIKAVLYNNEVNNIYFHQSENGPYDPSGVIEKADKYIVPGMSELIRKIPDYISVNLSDGKVRVDNSENTLVELNRTYNFSADYDVYIPFEFESGLKIVYTDSLENIHDDIQDYEADSAAISATIENSVPLDLDLELIPVDLNGDVIPSIHVDKVKVNAAKGNAPENTDVYINIKLDNRSELKKLDKLRFRISASSINNGILNSQQYIQAKDIRLILKGQVVCDFN